MIPFVVLQKSVARVIHEYLLATPGGPSLSLSALHRSHHGAVAMSPSSAGPERGGTTRSDASPAAGDGVGPVSAVDSWSPETGCRWEADGRLGRRGGRMATQRKLRRCALTCTPLQLPSYKLRPSLFYSLANVTWRTET